MLAFIVFFLLLSFAGLVLLVLMLNAMARFCCEVSSGLDTPGHFTVHLFMSSHVFCYSEFYWYTCTLVTETLTL